MRTSRWRKKVIEGKSMREENRDDFMDKKNFEDYFLNSFKFLVGHFSVWEVA